MQKILQANFIVWVDPAKMEATAKINANDMQITVTQTLFQQKGIYHLVCKPTSDNQWELLSAHLISQQSSVIDGDKDMQHTTDAALAIKPDHKTKESAKEQAQPIASFSPPTPKLQPATSNTSKAPATKGKPTGAAQAATAAHSDQATKAAKKTIAPTPPPPPTKANRTSASKKVQGGFFEAPVGAPNTKKPFRKPIISPAAAGIDAISSDDVLDF